jgi:hypothetical protein
METQIPDGNQLKLQNLLSKMKYGTVDEVKTLLSDPNIDINSRLTSEEIDCRCSGDPSHRCKRYEIYEEMLELAVETGRLEMVKVLVEANISTYQYYRAFKRSVKKHNTTEISKYLISMYYTNMDYVELLKLCVEFYKPELLRYAIESIQGLATDNYYELLQLSINCRQIETTKYILERCIEPLEPKLKMKMISGFVYSMTQKSIYGLQCNLDAAVSVTKCLISKGLTPKVSVVSYFNHYGIKLD